MQELSLEATLFGKHFSTSEYLHLGNSSDFMRFVLEWVESGYETLLRHRKVQTAQELQHFYFLNKEKDSFISGTIMLSRDSSARKYPLVMAVEVQPFSYFQNPDQALTYSQKLGRKMSTILKEAKSIDALKDGLQMLQKDNEVEITDGELPLCVFMNEDFSKSKSLYRPVEINDFIEIMR